MRSDLRHAATALLAGALAAGVLTGAGCGRRSGPPTITMGAPCDGCGMAIRDLRYACVRDGRDQVRTYDSIECLLTDGPWEGERIYLVDYEAAALHAVDSLWVVRGSFPSPMGGGFAAFLRRESADEIAAATRGRVARLESFLPADKGGAP